LNDVDASVSGIRLKGVSKHYGSDVVAIANVTLEIAPGEFMVLVGPSGCGKSTLLRIIAGLEELTAGNVTIGERDVTHLAPQARDIAMVFQSYALYPHMTVRENLAYGLKARGVRKSAIRERVESVATMLGLEDLLDRRPPQLSGGQRQRVAIGRATVREPRAFLMDEPLSNLDAKLRVSMRAELQRLHQRLGTTTVYVTHDQVEAMTLGDRVAVLHDGVLQQCDSPKNLFDRPTNLFVAAFIGSPQMNLVEAELVDGEARFANYRLPLTDSQKRLGNRTVVLGVRPTDLLIGNGSRSGASLEVEASLVEELGSERHVVFLVDAPRLESETTRAAAHGSADEEGTLFADERRAVFTAVLPGRDDVRAGNRLTFEIDPHALHFFDPASGIALR
jgi:multiple sugar transport system ATP-binding protein